MAGGGGQGLGVRGDRAGAGVNKVGQKSGGNKAGKPTYPAAAELLTTAGCGGPDGSRVRQWKTELAVFAAQKNRLQTLIHVEP